MSKKRFTEGLESIFGEAAEETLQENSPLLSSTQEAKSKPSEENRRSSGKNFSSDLQDFLQDAFEESLDKQIEERKKTSKLQEKAKVKKRYRRPMGGLDALIRSTIEPQNVRVAPERAKRVTLTFDPQKLEKLKEIARHKKSYLRDIIDEIVADFLDTYKNEDDL